MSEVELQRYSHKAAFTFLYRVQEETFIPSAPPQDNSLMSLLKKVGVHVGAGRTYRDDSDEQVSSIHLHPKRAFIIFFLYTRWLERQEGAGVVKTL